MSELKDCYNDLKLVDEFLQIVKSYIIYWNNQNDCSLQEKLEGLAFSILATLDGVTSFSGDIETLAKACSTSMLHELLCDLLNIDEDEIK